MLSGGTCIVALHLLCITNVVNPLVLFSANVEDIKKIARKIIREPLADHLVDLIFDATSGPQNGKISAENVKNAEDIDQASYERSAKRTKDKTSQSMLGTMKDIFGDMASLTEEISLRKEPDESKSRFESVTNAVTSDVNKKKISGVLDEEKETSKNMLDKVKDMFGDLAYLTQKVSFRKEPDESKNWFESAMDAVTSDVKKKKMSEVLNDEQQIFKTTKMHKKTPVDRDNTENAKENYKLDSADFFEDEVLNYPMHVQNQEYGKERLVATSGPVNLPRIQEMEW